MQANSSPAPSAPFVGDDLALDFINTRYGVGAARRDCLADGACVLAWLRQAAVLPDDVQAPPRGLLKLALDLRENAAELVAAAKSGREVRADVVNRVLEAGRATRELRWDAASRALRVVTTRRRDDAASLLEPVAQALVDLLTGTPLELVKSCEAHDCTLLFHDLTKSHRRRWCSMAVCGNRTKVAAFRGRQARQAG